ncbi:MAG: T9SS type A sorting domain-containing protein [candidate division KSB1 bacterium]|nr:T9SS type A sorting domain-containing protein [candidate division KSB1 bacterium]
MSAFNGDDAFDYDEGFRGKGQFWFAIQASDIGNRAGEHDGGTTPEDGQPYATPQIYNVTYIGSGQQSTNADNDLTFIFRDNAGGKYVNSIFTDFAAQAIKVEDLASGEDSRARLEAGDLVLSHNLWYGYGAGNDWTSMVPQDFVRAYLQSNDNRLEDPQLRGISRVPDGGLDPRPQAGSPAFTNVASVPDDGFFVQTDYLGAFGEVNWAVDWTFLGDVRIISPFGAGIPANVTGISEQDEKTTRNVPQDYLLEQNYPNPFNPETRIAFSLPQAGHVTLKVFDTSGRQVATLIDGYLPSGSHNIIFRPQNLASGVYYYQLRSAQFSLTRKMILVR